MKTKNILFGIAFVAALSLGLLQSPPTATAKTEASGDAAVAMIDRDDTTINNDSPDNSKNNGAKPNEEAGDADDDNGDADDGKSQPEDADVPPPAPKPAAHKKNDKPGGAAANKDTGENKTAEKNAEGDEIPAGNWWRPHPGIKWQIQYSGFTDTSFDVAAYDFDLIDTDIATIKALHGRGIKVICYFSAGSFEKWRADANRFPASVLGRSNGWRDEKWLDIRKIDVLKPIMAARIDLAAAKGCDAVDPDNVEGYDNKSGFPLTYKDQLAYNKMIAGVAHKAGLAVGLKNDLDQVENLIGFFDFAVNEQCFEYQSCEELVPFIKANKPVFNIEYNLDASKFCSQANEMNFDSVKKDLDLDAKVKFCR